MENADLLWGSRAENPERTVRRARARRAARRLLEVRRWRLQPLRRPPSRGARDPGSRARVSRDGPALTVGFPL